MPGAERWQTAIHSIKPAGERQVVFHALPRRVCRVWITGYSVEPKMHDSRSIICQLTNTDCILSQLRFAFFSRC